jgi:glycosyltransferase involved in cell wall biosynthesis
MRIFTCTPVAFGGGPDFFARDSGLLCRGLQSIGIESRAIMPGEKQGNDEADLVRTEYANLESASWWREQKIDALVLYAWGRPKFRKVAQAIREAGVFLILNQDNSGFISPLAGCMGWLKEKWIMSGQGADWRSWLRFLILAIKEATYGLLITDPLRAKHLKQGDVIACVSPQANKVYARLCRRYGGNQLASKVNIIPHAVETLFRDQGKPRLNQIVCIGRWSDELQKRQHRLTEVLTLMLGIDESVSVVIMGDTTDHLRRWHECLDKKSRARVRLAGKLNRSELASILAQSRIFYSPSAYESFGIAAAEALCSGCSVVAHRSVSMPSFEWFISENSGTLAMDDTIASHIHALKEELHAWEIGRRDAQKISNAWSQLLHANKVAKQVAEICQRRSRIGDNR